MSLWRGYVLFLLYVKSGFSENLDIWSVCMKGDYLQVECFCEHEAGQYLDVTLLSV